MNRDIGLTGLIASGDLQELLDAYAAGVNMSAYALDLDGLLTRISAPTEFISSYLRATEEGRSLSDRCDLRAGEAAARAGRPYLYTSPAGLSCFAVPVKINGVHSATLIGGQTLTEEPDISEAIRAANELGVDPDEYISALKQIPASTKEQVNNAAALLLRLADMLGDICDAKLSSRQTEESIEEKNAELKADYQQVQEQSGELIDGIKTLSVEFEKISKRAEVADKTVSMTDSILNYLQNVATQMTLLGFNASIEAKHAGDAGAGFNVIAQEVRRLAEQTSNRIRSVEEVLNSVKMSIKNIEQDLVGISERVKENTNTVRELDICITSAAEKIDR